MTPVIQIIQALEAKLARAPIILKGFQLDKDGNLIKGEVGVDRIPRPDTQFYYISYTREWELGLVGV